MKHWLRRWVSAQGIELKEEEMAVVRGAYKHNGFGVRNKEIQ